MADDDGGEKTEAPTARRRGEARDQGNIAKSPDLSAAALLIGILIMMRNFGPGVVNALKLVVSDMLSASSLSNFDGGTAAVQVARALAAVGAAMAPMFAGIMLIAIVVNMSQVGLYLNLNRLAPNLGALNPIRGLSRLLGGGRGPIQLGMNFLKVLLVGTVAYSAVHGRMGQIMSCQQLTFQQVFGLGAQIVYAIAMRIGILLFVLAIFDYMYQRYRIEQSLKMSKEEVKNEMRSMDGDPKIKARRRQIAMQRHVQRLKKEVPKADVVITNPTHFSIALKYDSAKMRAPRVVAKGQDFMAHRIREIAIAAGVPIVERPAVARALYRLCDVGDEIPEKFYSAVAEILAYVYQLARQLKKAG